MISERTEMSHRAAALVDRLNHVVGAPMVAVSGPSEARILACLRAARALADHLEEMVGLGYRYIGDAPTGDAMNAVSTMERHRLWTLVAKTRCRHYSPSYRATMARAWGSAGSNWKARNHTAEALAFRGLRPEPGFGRVVMMKTGEPDRSQGERSYFDD